MNVRPHSSYSLHVCIYICIVLYISYIWIAHKLVQEFIHKLTQSICDTLYVFRTHTCIYTCRANVIVYQSSM